MKNMMIAVCTYNRKDIIEYSSKSLYEIDNIDVSAIKIFDDCSNEFDINFLREKYHGAEINISEKNLGADYNMKKVFEYFLNSKYEYLFVADSDLIFSKNVIKVIKDNIKKLEKKKENVFFSVFNTKKHKTIGNYDFMFCEKENVGAAGCVFSKKVVNLFFSFIPINYDENIPSIDHFFCKKLSNESNHILCTNNSYVQHIGLNGQNSNFLSFDWGINFEIDTITNAKAIVYVLEKTFSISDISIQNFIITNVKNGVFGIKFSLKILYITIINKIKKICGCKYGKKNNK